MPGAARGRAGEFMRNWGWILPAVGAARRPREYFLPADTDATQFAPTRPDECHGDPLKPDKVLSDKEGIIFWLNSR